MPPIRGDHSSAARALTLLRIFLGVIFLVAATGKFQIHRVAGVVPLPMASSQWQVELPERLGGWLADHPDGVTAAVTRDVLIPNGRLVAGAVAWLQLGAGVGLLLGFCTWLAALVAAAVAAALAFSAASRQAVDARPYALLAVMAFTLLIGGAGRYFAVDAWRRERRRRQEF